VQERWKMAETQSDATTTQVKLPAQTLEGKVAIVTGSSRGLGADMALDLARRGANVSGVSFFAVCRWHQSREGGTEKPVAMRRRKGGGVATRSAIHCSAACQS
jgi:hypothetical protein